jgi:hypothetical protein
VFCDKIFVNSSVVEFIGEELFEQLEPVEVIECVFSRRKPFWTGETLFGAGEYFAGVTHFSGLEEGDLTSSFIILPVKVGLVFKDRFVGVIRFMAFIWGEGRTASILIGDWLITGFIGVKTAFEDILVFEDFEDRNLSLVESGLDTSVLTFFEEIFLESSAFGCFFASFLASCARNLSKSFHSSSVT